MHATAPIQICRPSQPDGRVRLVARCDGRYLGSAFMLDPSRKGFTHSEQWARAFLAACAVAPFVSGVRA